MNWGESTYHSDGDSGRIWKYKFDFIELLSATPVLCERDPSCARISKAVCHYHSRSVLLDCGDYEGGWFRHCVCRVVVFVGEEFGAPGIIPDRETSQTSCSG